MINKQQRTLSVTTEQAGEQMSMPARLRTKEIRWRCCRKHTGIPRSNVSLPETCREELWRMEEREVSGLRSDNTSSSTMCDAPFLSTSPSFYRSRREPFPSLTILPNKSNYLGSLLYLIPSYIHRRARTREGPVPTLYTPIVLGDGFLHDNVGTSFATLSSAWPSVDSASPNQTSKPNRLPPIGFRSHPSWLSPSRRLSANP